MGFVIGDFSSHNSSFGLNKLSYILLVLGLIVGLLNVSEKEVGSFLIAAIAFMFTFTALGNVAVGIPIIGDTLARFFNLVNTFVAPAAAVVAFKALFAHARN